MPVNRIARPTSPAVRVLSRIDYEQDGRGLLNDIRRQLTVVNVASGKRRQVSQEPLDRVDLQRSPAGKTLATNIWNRNGIRLAESSEYAVDTGFNLLAFVIDNSSTPPSVSIGPDDCNWIGSLALTNTESCVSTAAALLIDVHCADSKVVRRRFNSRVPQLFSGKRSCGCNK